MKNYPSSLSPQVDSSSIPADFSSQGWIINQYSRRMLWVPAHFRGGDAAATQGSGVVWFDSNQLPMIVTGLGGLTNDT
jgi:hypothetical protein